MNTVSPGAVTSPLWTDPDGFGGRVSAAFGVGHSERAADIHGADHVIDGTPSSPPGRLTASGRPAA